MQKVMIFIDFENFNIAMIDYYRSMGRSNARLEFNQLPKRIVELLPGESNRLVKTFLFAPKPDSFLLQDDRRKNTYNWIRGLENQKYFTVITGEHIARPTAGLSKEQMDISKKGTYYIVEKGTDVNMATHLITKGFMHAYDTAVLVSGDSDYIPILDVLNTLGKTTVVAGVQGQNLYRVKNHCDDIVVLDDRFFSSCLRD